MTVPSVRVPGGPPRGFDPAAPSAARMHNYLAGGANHGEADETAAAVLEGICPEARPAAASNRLFAGRAAAYAASTGVTQVIDLGCGVPPAPYPHQAAAGAAAAYVDLDRLALDDLDVLLGDGGDRDRVALVCADLAGPGAVLSDPGLLEVIDPGRPVLVLLLLVLHFMPPGQARRVVAGYADRVAAGSLVAVSVPRFGDPGVLAALREAYAPARVYEFTPAEITGLFAGLEVVAPGIAPAAWLRPGWKDARLAPPDGAHIIAGIGRKP